jgi:hypothetical protein
LRQTRGAKKIPKTVLKATFKAKKTTYTLVFGKYIAGTFRSHSIRAFSVFLEHFGLSQEPDGLEKI